MLKMINFKIIYLIKLIIYNRGRASKGYTRTCLEPSRDLKQNKNSNPFLIYLF